MSQQWEKHYTREKSVLAYPDENLVRLLRTEIIKNPSLTDYPALDLGCGTGRHLKLLNELGFKSILGLDSSTNALDACRIYNYADLICADNTNIPLEKNSIGIVIAWGSLHYNPEEDLPSMIKGIHRILVQGGHIFATLRSERDTYLKRGEHLHGRTWMTELPDLHGSLVSFYSESDITLLFKEFTSVTHGLMERTPMGDTGRVISHWIIHAKK